MLPMGCGEQNLAKLAPNIFALKYMNALSYTNNKLKETALKNIRKGKSCYDILYFIVYLTKFFDPSNIAINYELNSFKKYETMVKF